MSVYLRISILLLALLLASCAFRAPLKATTTINGMNAFDTVVVVDKDYLEKGTHIPKGNYYPSHEVTSGYVVYKSGNPIKVNSGWAYLWTEDVCEGGIAIRIDKPQHDYFLALEQCFGDPHLRIDIQKILEFSIVSKRQKTS